ncbi:MAG: hypothetical protein ACREPX_00110, partial [Rhodanobacteraceae bacterium]
GPSLGALTFGHDGNLYGTRVATTGDYTTGAILRINTANGVATPVSSNLKCPFSIATDPLSGDLFATDGCFGGPPDDASIWRVTNPGGSPSTSVYAQSSSTPNGGLSFAPDGTLYVVYAYNSVVAGINEISGTNQAQPPTVGSTGIYSTFAVTALGNAPGGGAQSLVVGSRNVGGLPFPVAAIDMTLDPPAFTGTVLEETGAGAQRLIGPDGCFYLNASVAVYRLSNADGTCPTAPQLAPDPALLVSPQTNPPTEVQGILQSFVISFPHTSIPVGTPISVVVAGANSIQRMAYTGFGEIALFQYTGAHVGEDTLAATAVIDGETVVSNRIAVTWTSGRHTSYLALNGSDTSGSSGGIAHAVATLLDLSIDPPAPIAGAAIDFTLAAAACGGTTNASGVATCDLSLAGIGVQSLTAAYSGDPTHLPANDAEAFHVLDDHIFANGFDP